MDFFSIKNSFVKIITSLLVIVLVISCNSGSVDTSADKNIKTQDTGEFDNLLNDKLVNSNKLIYVKPNSLVFFSMSDKEFKQFLHRTGKYSEWKFEIIYKRFRQQVKNTKKALRGYKIKTIYTYNPEIAFLTKTGDTLFFSRKDNDLFIGQIFFTGTDTLYIEDGLMKKDSLIKKIKNYFNLSEDINIKQVQVRPVNQKVIEKDSSDKQDSDSLAAP